MIYSWTIDPNEKLIKFENPVSFHSSAVSKIIVTPDDNFLYIEKNGVIHSIDWRSYITKDREPDSSKNITTRIFETITFTKT